MKSTSSLKRNTVVTLLEDQSTLTNIFKAGDTFKFLSIFSGSFIRLSRIGDNAKLIVTPGAIGYGDEIEPAAPYVAPARLNSARFDYAHTDESGPSREIITSVCLAGKDSSISTIHLTPSEELAYNTGMARMAEMG
jgi:hypothetical protein